MPLLLGLMGCFEDEPSRSSDKELKKMVLTFGEVSRELAFENYVATVILSQGASTEAKVEYQVSDNAKLMKGDANVENGATMTFEANADTKFKVVAQDESSVDYTVKVNVSTEVLAIEYIKVKVTKGNQVIQATKKDGAYSIELPYGTDLAKDELKLDIKHSGKSSLPAQDAALQFTEGKALDIVITKQDGSTQTVKLTATVSKQVSQIKEVEQVTVELTDAQKAIGSDPNWGEKIETKIDKVNNQVQVTLPTSVLGKIEGQKIKTVLGLSPGATMTSTDEDVNVETKEVTVKFNKTYEYTVTDQAGNKTKYTLKFVQKKSAAKELTNFILKVAGKDYPINFRYRKARVVMPEDAYTKDQYNQTTLKPATISFTLSDGAVLKRYSDTIKSGVEKEDIGIYGSTVFKFKAIAQDQSEDEYGLQVAKFDDKSTSVNPATFSDAGGTPLVSKQENKDDVDIYTVHQMDMSKGINTYFESYSGVSITREDGTPFINGQPVKYTPGVPVSFKVTSADGTQTRIKKVQFKMLDASTKNELSSFELKDASDRLIPVRIEGTIVTVSIPLGVSTKSMVIKTVVSQFASKSIEDGFIDLTVGQDKELVITAQSGATQTYTIKPVLNTAGRIEATRTSGRLLQGLVRKVINGVVASRDTTIYKVYYGDNHFVSSIKATKHYLGRTPEIIFEYDVFNNISKKIVKLNGKVTTELTYMYDADGKIIQSFGFNQGAGSGGAVKWRETATYTYSGSKLSKKTIKLEYTNVFQKDQERTETYTIDSKGNLEGIARRDSRVTASTFDDKKNPFLHLFPEAYRATYDILFQHEITGLIINQSSANNRNAYNSVPYREFTYNAAGFLTGRKRTGRPGNTEHNSKNYIEEVYTYEQ